MVVTGPRTWQGAPVNHETSVLIHNLSTGSMADKIGYVDDGLASLRADTLGPFLHGLHDDWQIPANVLSLLLHKQRVLVTEIYSHQIQLDTTNFDESRFLLAVAVWNLLRVRAADREAFARDLLALGSVMFRKGRLGNNYTLSLFESRALGAFEVEYLLHHPTRRGMYENMGKVRGSDYAESCQALLGKLPAVRDEVFRAHWLPGLLTQTEWARVRNLPTTLLRELYPTIHDRGAALLYAKHGTGVRPSAEDILG